MKVLAIILLIGIGLNCFGQVPKLKRKTKKAFTEAKILLRLEDYYNAQIRYDALLKVDSNYHEFNYGMGVCLLNTRGKEKQAHIFIKKGHSNENSISNYWFGRSLHLQKKFDEAISAYQDYRKNPVDDIMVFEADRQIAKSRLAKEMLNQPRRIEISNLGANINSKYQDAAPVITSDESIIYFTSRREMGASSEVDPTGQNYQDIYYSEKTEDGWSNPKNVGSLVNSSTHDATAGLSGNGNVLITYRTNPNIVGGDLYITENKEGAWLEPIKLGEMINSDYQEPCATITSDESVMYFSSNRPGGYGGMDLYRAKKLPNGTWSLPLNLGPSINTAYNEDAPFISVNGTTLYFSSEGHPGIGGYDVFQSSILNDGSWTTPKNLGYPVNSVEHDIYFTISADERVAYYSSDSEGGYGDQDIYKIVFKDKPEDMAVVSGIVTDENGKPIKAKITVLETNPERVSGIYRSSASKGNFITLLYPGISFQLIIEAEGFQPEIRNIDLIGSENRGQAEEMAGSQKIVMKKE